MKFSLCLHVWFVLHTTRTPYAVDVAKKTVASRVQLQIFPKMSNVPKRPTLEESVPVESHDSHTRGHEQPVNLSPVARWDLPGGK